MSNTQTGSFSETAFLTLERALRCRLDPLRVSHVRNADRLTLEFAPWFLLLIAIRSRIGDGDLALRGR